MKLSRRLASACQILIPGLLGTSLAFADVFILPANDGAVGAVNQVSATYEDTLTDIGRRHGLGYEEIVLANRDVDAWLPGEGTTVTLPTRYVLPDTPRRGVVINLAEYRMYYFHGGEGEQLVSTFPISIGRMDWDSPLGRASIVAKTSNPAWYPPKSIREEYAADGRSLPPVVPAGPDNPLGEFALRLSVPGYLIHGTNRPAGVGMRVTHGCIRMFPEDIAWLFPAVDVKTSVRLLNQPVKLGWSGDALLLEVHPPLEDDATGQERGLTAITERYVQLTDKRPAVVDWSLVEKVYAEHSGIPVVIGQATPSQDVSTVAARSP
jgi:L,D-transpeptidase ErfK/SrfK